MKAAKFIHFFFVEIFLGFLLAAIIPFLAAVLFALWIGLARAYKHSFKEWWIRVKIAKKLML